MTRRIGGYQPLTVVEPAHAEQPFILASHQPAALHPRGGVPEHDVIAPRACRQGSAIGREGKEQEPAFLTAQGAGARIEPGIRGSLPLLAEIMAGIAARPHPPQLLGSAVGSTG